MYHMDYKTEAGDPAPDFTAQTSDGRSFRLYDLKNRKTAVLFFFDHHDERCLQKLASLARDYSSIQAAGGLVLPLTVLKVPEGKKLAEQLNLPFPVLCDDDHTVVSMYKAGECAQETSHVCFEIITGVTKPAILIIDPSGTIRHRHVLKTPGGQPDNETLLKECREALR